MTDLRDARLQRALHEAPDGQLRPDARTRRQVLDAARAAVAPMPRVSWLRRLWQASGDRRMPWSAALATVVLASMVTVLWYEREVPGAGPGGVGPDQRAPAATPQSAPAAASAAAPAPAAPAAPEPALRARPQPAFKAEPGPAAGPEAQPSPSAAPARRAAPRAKAPSPAADTQRPAPALEVQREQRVETPKALRDREVRALAKGEQNAGGSGQPERAAAGAAAMAPPPPAPADRDTAAEGAMAGTAPAALASRSATSAAQDWSHLRVLDQARSVEVTRDQAPRLAQLASALARETQGSEPLQGPVSTRIEFRRAGEVTGVIELAGPQVRWTRWRGGQGESFTARPPAAQLQALRDEIERLQQR